MANDRPAERSSSTKSTTRGMVHAESFSVPTNGDDMQSQMLATLFDSAAFKIVCFTVGYPRFPRFGNCLARAGRRVNALLNFVSCGDSPGVGF